MEEACSFKWLRSRCYSLVFVLKTQSAAVMHKLLGMHTCMDEAVVSGPVLDLWSNTWVKGMDPESLIWKKKLKNDGLSSGKKQTSRGVRSLSHGGKRHSGLGQGGWA